MGDCNCWAKYYWTTGITVLTIIFLIITYIIPWYTIYDKNNKITIAYNWMGQLNFTDSFISPNTTLQWDKSRLDKTEQLYYISLAFLTVGTLFTLLTLGGTIYQIVRKHYITRIIRFVVVTLAGVAFIFLLAALLQFIRFPNTIHDDYYNVGKSADCLGFCDSFIGSKNNVYWGPLGWIFTTIACGLMLIVTLLSLAIKADEVIIYYIKTLLGVGRQNIHFLDIG